MKSLFILFLCCITLFGCGKESELIEAAKGSAINDEFTYQQAFEKSYCEDVDWKAGKDENNRDEVLFKCEFTIPSNVIERHIFDEAQWVENVYSQQPYYKEFYQTQYYFYDHLSDYDSKYGLDGVEKLRIDYGIHSKKELENAIETLKTIDEKDKKALKDIAIPEYAKLLIKKYPKSVHVVIETGVIFLPNSKTKWYTPNIHFDGQTAKMDNYSWSFNKEILNGYLSSQGKEKYFLTILKYGMPVTYEDKESFANYIAKLCESTNCPVIKPQLDYFFGERVNEGDDWK